MSEAEKISHKVRNRILLSFVFISVCVLFIVMVSNYNRIYDSTKNIVIELSKSSSTKNALDIEMFFLRHEDVLLTTAEALEYEIKNGNTNFSKIETLLKDISLEYDDKIYSKYSNKQFTGIYVALDGKLVHGLNSPDDLPTGYNPLKRQWYIEGLQGRGKVVFGEPYWDIYNPRLVMTATKLLSDNKTVLGMDITLDDLQFAGGNMDFSVNLNGKKYIYGYGFVTTENGIVVAHKDTSQQGNDYNNKESPMYRTFQQIKQCAVENRDYFETKISGVDYAIFPHKLNNGWYVVTLTEVQEMKNSVGDVFLIIFAVTIFVLVLALGYSTFITISQIKSEKLTNSLSEALILAKKDGLTGQGNRTAYDIRINEFKEKIMAKVNDSFAIIMMDLNDLKYINDNYGHAAGDQYIRNSCNIIHNIVESEIYRIGGDEFAIFLTDDLYKNADNLCELLKLAVEEGNRCVVPNVDKPSIAIGMATHEHGIDEDIEMILHKADTLMYTNKALIKQARLKSLTK